MQRRNALGKLIHMSNCGFLCVIAIEKSWRTKCTSSGLR
jgi:hypothetical protein